MASHEKQVAWFGGFGRFGALVWPGRRAQAAGVPAGALVLRGVWRRQVAAEGWLRVLAGPVWLTRDGDPDDHVLQAGDELRLRAGDWVTAEPWRPGQTAQLAWCPSVSPAAAGHAQSGFLASAVRAP